MAGLGPAPFAGMMLADMGADLILIERKADPNKFRIPDCNRRGKRYIDLNLKDEKIQYAHCCFAFDAVCIAALEYFCSGRTYIIGKPFFYVQHSSEGEPD